MILGRGRGGAGEQQRLRTVPEKFVFVLKMIILDIFGQRTSSP